jgi:signal transduction histidine kinase
MRDSILLVEDDGSIRDVLHNILEDEGYEVELAENGRQALDRLRGGAAPDLIVLDLRMPVMDGWEFRAAQKSDPTLAHIPVIAISADSSAKAEAIAAQAYLRKPLSTGALLDAISRVLAEAEKRELLGRLEEAERFAALGRLAAVVGHEINNPLAYVTINVGLVHDDVDGLLGRAAADPALREELERVRAMLDDCRTGLDRMRDIVKNLQSLSRTPEVRHEPFSLNDILDESLSMARHHLERRATLIKDYGVLPPFVGNRSAMGQVFLNLLINAAQAIPGGRAATNRVVLTTTATGGEVTIEIRDTGQGIPGHVLPHIFDPFYTTKPVGEGTGLGLSVSSRIVAECGGRIEVESTPGQGTLVRVVLPIGEEA